MFDSFNDVCEELEWLIKNDVIIVIIIYSNFYLFCFLFCKKLFIVKFEVFELGKEEDGTKVTGKKINLCRNVKLKHNWFGRWRVWTIRSSTCFFLSRNRQTDWSWRAAGENFIFSKETWLKSWMKYFFDVLSEWKRALTKSFLILNSLPNMVGLDLV